MKTVCILFICFVLLRTVYAQNEDAEVLLKEETFEVEGPGSADYTLHLRIRINNKRGISYTHVKYNEDIYRKIGEIEAFLTDTAGNRLKELDEDDIHFSTVTYDISDHKYYWFDLVYHTFPFILEYTIHYRSASLLNWPDWYPQSDIPVRRSVYRVVLNEPVPFHTYTVGIDATPDTVIADEIKTITWELTDIGPGLKEDFLPPENRNQQVVYFMPDEFEVDGIQGRSRTWAELGAWVRGLFQDKYDLSPEVRSEVSMLIRDCQGDREKIDRLYNYLQDKTRYVAIELGLGKWQPYDAQWVYNNCYGDCKDLSAFMIGLLRLAGIKAYPALMLTRDIGVVYPDFPANRFNHVITYVPMKNQDIWLESTADYIPAGALPYDREGCLVLVVMDSTARLMQTPESSYLENRRTSRITAKIGPVGNLMLEGRISASGDYRYNMDYLRETKTSEDFQDEIRKWFGYYESSLSLESYSVDSDAETFRIDVKGSLSNTILKSGKRVFLNPNIMNRITTKNIPDEEERKYPVYFRDAYSELDTIDITLHGISGLESAPEPLLLDNDIGYYRTRYDLSPANHLTYIREFACKKRIIPVEEYGLLTDFMKRVAGNDDRKFVFLK
jgi:hypothetical protein